MHARYRRQQDARERGQRNADRDDAAHVWGERDTERGNHIRVLHTGANDPSERRSLQQEPQESDGRRGNDQHQQPILRIDEIADQNLSAQRIGNREWYRRRTEDQTQRLLRDHRQTERQQQAERRIRAIEAAKQESLDDETEQRNEHRRCDHDAGEAQHAAQLDREVRAECVESPVREVDQAAQREDERQTQRNQQVIRTDQQPVEDLLEDLNGDHGKPARDRDRTRTALHYAGIVQAFSSRVGASTSRLSLA